MTIYASPQEKIAFKGLLKEVYAANEAPANPYQFILSTGNSTYSFGQAQWDVGNNEDAKTFLRTELGFSALEIAKFSSNNPLSSADLATFNQRLQNNKVKVDQFFETHLDGDITFLNNLITELNLGDTQDQTTARTIASDVELQVLLLDFNNQYSIKGVNGSTGTTDGSTLRFIKGEKIQTEKGGDAQIVGNFDRGDWVNFVMRNKWSFNVAENGLKDVARRLTNIYNIAGLNVINGPNGSGVKFENAQTWRFVDPSGYSMQYNKITGDMTVTMQDEAVRTTIVADNSRVSYVDYANGQFIGSMEAARMGNGEVYTSYYNASNQLTGGQITYTAQPGDTVASVADKMGITPQKFLEFNPNLTAGSVIQGGSSLNIPVGNAGISLPHPTTPASPSPPSPPRYRQRTGLENVEQMGSWVTQGYAYYGANSRVSMPLDTLNGNGLWNTGMSGVVTDWLRPGNGNLSSSSMLGVFDEGPIDIFAPDPFGINFTSRPILFGSLNNLNLGANLFINIDPLVLDLNGDGVKLTDYGSNPVLFDIDNDGGSQEVTGWVSPQDGILVMDRNGNGRIDNISETFSEYFNGTAGTGSVAGDEFVCTRKMCHQLVINHGYAFAA
ncbi:MAG: LysM peptidoglycan-binding domain-containing protein [Gammaproteobacteria bacterium]|nr:LysM peptidoglycan-binding domain-containing protein [Gammaproteobacteria bacterium]